MEIVLVRHGRPSPLAGRMVSGRKVGDWVAGYNAAGLAETVAPPRAVQELVKSAGCVLASDLLRSLESARLLAPTGVRIDADLREAVLPSSMGVSVRLPASVWVVIARVAWWLNCRRSEEPIAAARARARRVADRLCALREPAWHGRGYRARRVQPVHCQAAGEAWLAGPAVLAERPLVGLTIHA